MRIPRLFGPRPRALSPSEQAIYKKAHVTELERIHRGRLEVDEVKIKQAAISDARRETTPKTARIFGGLKTVGKFTGEKLKKWDPEKFEAAVLGERVTKPEVKKPAGA